MRYLSIDGNRENGLETSLEENHQNEENWGLINEEIQIKTFNIEKKWKNTHYHGTSDTISQILSINI